MNRLAREIRQYRWAAKEDLLKSTLENVAMRVVRQDFKVDVTIVPRKD